MGDDTIGSILKATIMAWFIVMVMMISFFYGVHEGKQEQREIYALACGSGAPTSVEASTWDTTALNDWCGGACVGTVRMLAGHVYAREDDKTIVEDETGELWIAESINADDDDFLLLWLGDCGTNWLEDDVLVKVWVSADG